MRLDDHEEIILASPWSRLEFARLACSLVWKFEAALDTANMYLQLLVDCIGYVVLRLVGFALQKRQSVCLILRTLTDQERISESEVVIVSPVSSIT